MKINWNYIKMIGLCAVTVFLYAFATVRNNTRKVSTPTIEFLGEQNLFITHETVSKLLIQNQQGATSVRKETLDLNNLEASLNANPMIESAEVFVGVNGAFSARIKQKKPIARVSNARAYYIDSQGGFMPLSKNYTERVPLVTGEINKKKLANVFTIADKIYSDEFLKTNVVEIHQNTDNSIYLKLRQCQFKVQLGQLKHLDKKINNLKAFYQKAIKDKTLNKYSKVNLQFENQVVCTKV
jgi:cell division protein FtsQ